MRFNENEEFDVLGFWDESISQVRINHNNQLYFFIELLSPFPKSVNANVNKKIIQIYANELFRFDFVDDMDDTPDSRKENLKGFLKDYLIICNPSFKQNDDDGEIYIQGHNINLVRKDINFNNNRSTTYIAIPFFDIKSRKSIESKNAFIKNLYDEKTVGNPVGWSKEDEDYSRNIIWIDDDDHRTLVGEIIGQNYSQYGVTYDFDDANSYKIELSITNDEDWFYGEYRRPNGSVIFVPQNIYNKKIDQKNHLNLFESLNIVKENFKIEEIDNSEMSILKKEDEIPFEDIHEKEAQFIDRLDYLAERTNHLHYDKKDLINFHTSLKGDSLTILSGLSGTGKSQLVRTYARGLGVTNNLRFIPVRPFWEDDSDLLGYVDTVNFVYRPGDSGLLDLLIDASKNPDNIYMVCFDEMNLSKVEHYFSQFLSVLELESGKRKLRLYNPELKTKLYNSSKYDSEISIDSNVLFVGTINTDESTYQFSDKVLDRSNVIPLQIVPFGDIQNKKNVDAKKVNAEEFIIKNDDFKKFRKSNPQYALTQKEKEMLWEIHIEINSHDRNVGIGWRILNQIDEYLQNIPRDSELSREEALDYQILQRILTKIRGSEEQLSGMLGSWDNTNSTNNIGTLENILNSYSDSSSFEKSKKIIREKARELKLHGFTI
ncbi:McrB family protein [Lactococcus lactis]|uniref:McrB family protein n=1 Tax=Lactococcus lactis TaxID=1358 RepID=UPI0022E4BEF9|nr:hypothetical protein [Lactococcus lactis]MDA2885048.1 hypothetical protein [Lactococcus lactis]MDA2887553.1 hypothetical protein [Lactococcus lactis]MDA2907158.1 hypothetical protein [Lactococcus lactis]